ncbi:hypothetical protein QLQ15_01140 [Lysobacter sp. LF1]|uniref:Transmembrane protein n=1 Tax=Lysobacter stagni TaxID=3045172 RepID=A0ABT6XBK1_9GAMM|nr:hypothetical protein [Lysobacter sp. LF1]MDI9237517.1 hypothetical protein [Lysobacter sp. LF1]
MKLQQPQYRVDEVDKERRRLERDGWPRLQMSLIVMVTGAVGFLSSFVLLHAGIESMLLRYPLTVTIAYGAFLAQMWLWMRWRDDSPIDLAQAIDAPETHSTGSDGWAGSGGGSGGGGGSASWLPAGSDPASSGMSADGSVLDVVDADADLPLIAVLALSAVALVCVFATSWIIWTAPSLMAELVVDAAIAGGLYRRIRGLQSQGWWWLCVRHTFWPFTGVLTFFAALGGLAWHFTPEASTLMEALRAL